MNLSCTKSPRETQTIKTVVYSRREDGKRDSGELPPAPALQRDVSFETGYQKLRALADCDNVVATADPHRAFPDRWRPNDPTAAWRKKRPFPTGRRTGHVDPELPFKVAPVNEREAEESGLWVLRQRSAPNRSVQPHSAGCAGPNSRRLDRLRHAIEETGRAHPPISYEYAIVSMKQLDPKTAAALRRTLLWADAPTGRTKSTSPSAQSLNRHGFSGGQAELNFCAQSCTS